MKIKFWPSAITTIALFSHFSHSAVLLSDSFESGTMTTPAANSIGFRWESQNRTSVVTMLNGIATRVWDNGPTTGQESPKDWTAKEGSYSLRFRHPANTQMAEQRFTFGTSVPDLWMSYWIRVPKNFYHGSLNNKWLAVWTNVYDGPGDVTFQTRPYSSTPGGASLVVQDGGTTRGEVTVQNDFILVPRDLGRWMQITYRFKPASSSSANDGIIQVWRRWENETASIQIMSKTNARFYDAGKGISAGYLMGWENDPYKVETEFLVDSFKLANTSLLDTSTSTPSTTNVPPSPPILKVN